MISSSRRLAKANHPRGLAKLASLVVLTIVFAASLPLHAVDSDRPVKQRVAPAYPEIAKRMHISGMVKVAATVAPDGSVSSTRAVSGNRVLADAAEQAVHKWKFASAATESIIEVEINFALAQ
jgi:TonB family protein